MHRLKSEEASVIPHEEVAARLSTDIKTGLTWREAETRQKLYDFNELTVQKQQSLWSKYVEQVNQILRKKISHPFLSPKHNLH